MALLSVEDATARILKDVDVLASESCAIEDSHDRVLSRSITARHTQPPFDASAMDGYGVRAADVANLPARLKVIGESAAGSGFDRTVGLGEAVRIFTGAPVPTGADAIVIQENTSRDGDDVIVTDDVPNPDHIRKRGVDFREAQDLIASGTILSPRVLTLAAAAGYGALDVVRRPLVAILATGSELVAPGAELGPDQIVSSNPIGISGIVRNAGACVRLMGIAKDTRRDLEEKISAARDADILITIGGVSVGDHDLVGPVLKDMGLTPDFWKIAMRPGKPLLFGRLGAMRVIGVPGNPVSSLICTRVYVVPLVQKMLGLPPSDDKACMGKVQHKLPANGPRTHFMRGNFCRSPDGGLQVSAVSSQDSALLVPLVGANCLIVRPANAPEVSKGGNVTVLPLDM